MTDRMDCAKMRKLSSEEHVHKALVDLKRQDAFILIDTALVRISDGIDAALRKHMQMKNKTDEQHGATFQLRPNGTIMKTGPTITTLSTIFWGNFEDVFDACHEEVSHLHASLKSVYKDLFVEASINSEDPASIVLRFDWSDGDDDAPATE